MLSQTRGIVLHHIKYSESSVIAYVYTRQFGRQSYMINGVKGKKAKIKANLLQPLFLLDMEVDHKPNKDLQRIKEMRNAIPFFSIPYDITKNTIVLFLSEVLYRSLSNEEPDEKLFDFIFNAIRLLDSLEEGVANFHLLFLTMLTRYFGFFPNNNYDESHQYFDLMEGLYINSTPFHNHYLDRSLTPYFNQLTQTGYDKIATLKLPNSIRKQLLEKLIEYYQLHLLNLKEIKSHAILKAVFE